MVKAIIKSIKVVGSFVSFMLYVPVILPFAKAGRDNHKPWVIGGHRGRMREDNSAALHEYILAHGNHAVIWIANPGTFYASLKKMGIPVLKRGSLSARWTILRAPVLIYSHGEDDLDIFLRLLRPWLGFRIFINHCMKHMKTGQLHRPDIQRAHGIRRLIHEFIIQDFDVVLASSEREKRNFELCYSISPERVIIGGGAHIDSFLKARQQPTKRNIFYFPTFRQDSKGKKLLNQNLQALVKNKTLQSWLNEKDFCLYIGNHINSKQPRSTLPDNIYWVDPDQVKKQLFDCQLFISDYSGLIIDYLVLHKPIILFPFDLNNYLKTRSLFSDYQETSFGPVVYSVTALIKLLVSETWTDIKCYSRAKTTIEKWAFPYLEPVYSRNCYETIVQLLKEKTKSAEPWREFS